MQKELKIAAVILAAGQGKRYGCPKIRAEINGELFAERVLRSLQQAGINDYKIVVSKAEYEFAVSHFEPGKLVVNPLPDGDMFSSVKAGIAHCLNYDGVMIWPVDHPLVEPETLQKLLVEFQAAPCSVVKPQYAGRGGHPVILPGSVLSLIISNSNFTNLQEIMHNDTINVIEVQVTGDGVLANLNYQNSIE